MSVINWGVRVECGSCACAYNFSLIEMSKEKLRGILHVHGFILLNVFVHTQLSGFCVRYVSVWILSKGLNTSCEVWPLRWAAPAAEAGIGRAPPWGREWESSWCPACWRAARARRCAARWTGRAAPALNGHSGTVCCQGSRRGRQAKRGRKKERERENKKVWEERREIKSKTQNF